MNRYRSLVKWISALRVMPQPGLTAARGSWPDPVFSGQAMSVIDLLAWTMAKAYEGGPNPAGDSNLFERRLSGRRIEIGRHPLSVSVPYSLGNGARCAGPLRQGIYTAEMKESECELRPWQLRITSRKLETKTDNNGMLRAASHFEARSGLTLDQMSKPKSARIVAAGIRYGQLLASESCQD